MSRKAFIKVLGALALLAASFTACEIGLGESVDTEAPVGEITSPGVNAVIRDAFMLQGNWKDDGTVSEVSVTLKSTDKELTVTKTYQASVSNGKWNAVIDPVKDSLLDGKYEATITLMDEGGHSSTIKRSYTIDNTPPVVILSYLKSAEDSVSEIKTYGKVFKLNGKAADANNIKKVDINIYNNSVCADSDLVATIEKQNLSGTIDKEVATFGTEDYTAIYGSADENADQLVQRWCKVFAYDEAQRYPSDGSAQSDEDKLGNCQKSYWLQSKIEELGYDIYNTNQLYAMYSGTYEPEDTTQASDTASINEVKEKLANLAAVSVGTFNLNPKNNPTFSVIGLNNVLKTGETMYDEAKKSQKTSYQITNGDEDTGIPLTITVTPGRDNYSINTESVLIYFQECDKDGNLKENAEKIIIAEKTSSVETEPVSTINYLGLETEKYYQVCVDGTDYKDNKIECGIDGTYSFYLAAVSGVIELNVSAEPNEQGRRGEERLDNTIYVSSATTNADYKELRVKLNYSYNGEKELKLFRKFDGEAFGKNDEPLDTPVLPLGNDKTYDDIIPASVFEGHTSVSYILRNIDGTNYSRAKSLDLRIDNSNPQILNPDSGNNVIKVPLASETSNNEFRFEGKASDVGSGVDKIFIKLYDANDTSKAVTKELNGTTAWSLTVIKGDTTYDAVLKKTVKNANGEDEKVDAQGSKKAEIWAVDEVGLESEHVTKDWIYKTTKPSLKTTYYQPAGGTNIAKNIDLMNDKSPAFAIGTKFTFKGIAEDGFGIKKITLIQTAEGSTESQTLTSDENGGIEYDSQTKAWIIPDLPVGNLPDGNTVRYEYAFTVTDEAELDTPANTLTVTVDCTPPAITGITLPGTANFGDEALSGTAYTIKGTAKDDTAGLGLKSIRYAIKKTGQSVTSSDWTDVTPNGENWSFTKNLASGTVGTDAALYEGKYTLYVKAVDNADNESAVISRSFCVDQTAPSVAVTVYKKAADDTVSVVDAKSDGSYILNEEDGAEKFFIEVKASDTNGLKSISAENGTDSVTLNHTDGIDIWTTDDLTAEQTYNFVITAEDISGNEKTGTEEIKGKATVAKAYVIFDKTKPSVKTAVLGSESTEIYKDSKVQNADKWYGSKSLKLVINASDDQSAVDSVLWSKDGTKWAELNPVKGETDTYKENIEFEDGGAQTFFVKVCDEAKNESAAIKFDVKIDETDAKLEGLFYKVEGGSLKNAGGTAYISENKTIILYGSFSDEESGVGGDVKFKVGDADVSATSLKYYTGTDELTAQADFESAAFDADYSSENAMKIKYFKAEFNTATLPSGKLSLSGKNGGGKETNPSVFTIIVDKKKPELKDIKLTTNDANHTVYQTTDAEGTVYYVNNTAGKFTISGLAEDNVDDENPAASGIDIVTLEIEGITETVTNADGSTTTKTKKFTSKTGAYFKDIPLNTLSGEGTKATLTVSDNAGNVSDSEVLNIKFDTAAPVGIHAFDGTGKDLFFRIGNWSRDDGVKKDAKGKVKLTNGQGTAVTGAPEWNKKTDGQPYTVKDDDGKDREVKIDEDVGGKYSASTYGNSESVDIRGTFADKVSSASKSKDGSGLSMIYYKVYTDKPDEAGNPQTADFLKNYKTLADGSFSPIRTNNEETLEQQAIRRVFYTPVTGELKDNLERVITSDGLISYTEKNENGIEETKTKNFTYITSSYWTTITGLKLNQANYLVLVAVDNVGNAAVETVDVQESNTTKAYTNYRLNVDKTEPEVKANQEGLIKYANGTSSFRIEGTAVDGWDSSKNEANGAGIDDVIVYATVNNTEVEFTAKITNAEVPATLTDEEKIKEFKKHSKKWEAEIDSSKLGNSGNVTISVRATDKAGTGNPISVPVATVIMDKDPPEVFNVKIGTGVTEKHEETSQVNGTFTLSGEAKDGKLLAEETETSKSLAVYYTTDSSVGAKKPVTDTIGTDASKKWKLLTNAEQGATWSVSIDSTKFDDNNDVWFSVAVKDSAGNTGYSDPSKVYVCQDTDRPVITLTNLELGTDAAENKPKLFANNVIYGNVSDDDGEPSKISYYVGDSISSSTEWTAPAPNSNFTYSNGSFTLKFADTEDGTKKIWFKVGDFVSCADTTYSKTNASAIQKSVKIKDSKGNEYGYRPGVPTDTDQAIKASVIYTIIDTKAPAIKDPEWAHHVTSGNTVWASTSNNPAAGGTKNKMDIHVYAYDANGVESIKIKVPKNAGDDSSKVTGFSTSENDNYVYNFKEDKTKKNSEDENYTLWTSESIDVTGMESSTRKCKLYITDNAGKTSTETINITVDNTPADFEFTSHKDDVKVYGIREIEVRGSVNDANISQVCYGFTKGNVKLTDEQKADASAAKTALSTTWNDVEFGSNKTSTVIKFDKDAETDTFTDSITHDMKLRYKLESLYEIEGGIDNYNETEDVKLWVYVVDELGNQSVPKSLNLKVIPNGDKPDVKITYPAEGAKLGGTIRFTGETTIETSSVEKVYAQILVPGATESDWVTKLDDLISETKNKSTGKEAFYKVDFIPGYDKTGEEAKGIEVSGTSASWNFTINSNHELEKDGETPDYTLKFIAKSASGKFSDVAERTIQIDKDAPVISNVKLIKLKNNNAAATDKFEEANIEKQIAYEQDMWISGLWYLRGSVKDGNGVKELKWEDVSTKVTTTLVQKEYEADGKTEKNTGKIVDANKDQVVQGDSHETKYDEGKVTEHTITAYDYDFYIPIGADTGFGKNEYKISAVDATSENNRIELTYSVNYDNEAPDFKATVSSADDAAELDDSGNKIQNSSGMYSVYGTFNEDGNQSGFERIAMYFTRTVNSKTSIVDPMVAKGNNKKANYYAVGTGSELLAGSDGIYWKELTGATISGKEISVTVSDSWVRKGGLCKVDGVIYKIKTVTSSKITVDVTLNETSENETKNVYVSPAMVIDNLSSESKKAGATYDGLYDATKPNDISVISGGDGDWLIEGVTKQGTSYPWTASLNSQNMLDGPVTIHFVAFDKAGNATEKTYEANVANNAPRLAGLTVWTDYNGNGTGWRNNHSDYKSETNSRYYSRVRPTINGTATDRSKDVTSKLIVSGDTNDTLGIAAASSTSFMKVTDTVKFIPEIVGGNGKLYYDYKIGKKAAFTLDADKNVTAVTASAAAGKVQQSASKQELKNDSDVEVTGSDVGEYAPTATDNSTGITYVNGSTEGVITFAAADILANLDTSTAKDPTWFDVVISDSTDGTPLSCEMQVALQVNYLDGTAPWAKIKPFSWSQRGNGTGTDGFKYNSVVWNGDSPLGHIELEDDLVGTPISATKVNNVEMGTDPKVSGKIIIEGTAYDDIRLSKLYAQFTDHKGISTYNTIAEYSTTNGVSTWKTKSGAGWSASVTDVSLDADGHQVRWSVTLDTEQVLDTAKVVGLDRAFTIYAEDAAKERGSTNGNSSLSSVGTTQTAKASTTTAAVDSKWTAYYKMDVVPYITGVETALQSKLKSSIKNAYSRTALGHYIARSTETVSIKGFNLTGAYYGNDALTVTDGVAALPVSKLTASGNVALKVVSGKDTSNNNVYIETLNNINNDNAKGSYSGTMSASSSYSDKNTYAYNRMANGTSNNNLTDNVYIDVWQFDSDAAVPVSGELREPVMKINPKTGKVGFAFVSGPADFAMADGNNNSYKIFQHNYATFSNVAMTYDDNGNSYGMTTGLDTYPSGYWNTLAGRFTFQTSKWGVGDLSMDDNYQYKNKLRLEAIGIPGKQCYVKGIIPDKYTMTETRFFSPSITAVSHDDKTSVYLAYYDNVQGQIRFRYGQEVGGSTDNKKEFDNFVDNEGINSALRSQKDTDEAPWTQNPETNQWFQDGQVKKYVFEANTEKFSLIAGTDWQKVKGKNDVNANKNGYTKNVGDNYFYDTGYEAGKYVAIDAFATSKNTSATDVVVAVWYDGTDCYYAYNTNPTSGNDNGTEGGWTTKKIIEEGGEHCTIKVGPDNSIHIAANKDGKLVYVYIPTYSGTPTSPVIVDSYGNTGEKINIDVGRKNIGTAAAPNYKVVPYISYYMNDARLPAVASLVIPTSGTMNYSAAGTDSSSMFTGNWEVSLVPSPNKIGDNLADKINIGLWKKTEGTGNNATKGVITTSTTGSNTSSGNEGNCFGNGTVNPIMGYSIKSSSGTCVETAQLK